MSDLTLRDSEAARRTGRLEDWRRWARAVARTGDDRPLRFLVAVERAAGCSRRLERVHALLGDRRRSEALRRLRADLVRFSRLARRLAGALLDRGAFPALWLEDVPCGIGGAPLLFCLIFRAIADARTERKNAATYSRSSGFVGPCSDPGWSHWWGADGRITEVPSGFPVEICELCYLERPTPEERAAPRPSPPETRSPGS